MAAGTSVYRVLVRLYPRRFREHYADDLILHFEDLVRGYGAGYAWRRTAVDLLVTVPRYRMETIMEPRHSARGVALLVAVFAVAGVLGFFVGFAAALLLVVVSIAIAVAERGRLASSLRPPTASRRQRLLVASGLLVLASLATVSIGFADLGDDDQWPTGRLLLYNAVFFSLLFAALACGVLGMLAVRSKPSSSSPSPP
jgi:hypothetical protein